jgi:hypothetical protein
MSTSHSNQVSASFSNVQGTPPITIIIVILLAYLSRTQDSELQEAINFFKADNYERALNILESHPNRLVDYCIICLRGVAKFKMSFTVAVIMINQNRLVYNCCFASNETIQVVNHAAMFQVKQRLLTEATMDLVSAFALSEGADNRIRSEIAHAVAVVYKEFNSESIVRAYISRAVELNPENMDARQSWEIHRKPITVVNVNSNTNITATATANSYASSNIYR